MDKDYLFFYTESMIVCIIIFAIMMIFDLVRGNRSDAIIRFDHALLAHILYYACDSIWAAIIAGAIPRTFSNVVIVNMVLLVLLCLVGKTWFQFTAALTKMPGRNTKAGKLIINAPIILNVLIVGIGMLVAPSAWITDEPGVSPLFNLFFVGMPIVYVISSMAYALYQAQRRENLLNRGFFRFLAIYPVTVVFAGLIQMTFLRAPIFCFSCTIMIIIFFINAMSRQISTDSLTQLNNRGQLARYTALDSSIRKEGASTFVVMVDIDDFKQINDTYGHPEGDRALVIVSDALRHAAENEKISPFLGRYGGDEFILIVYREPSDDGKDPDAAMESDIAALIERIRAEAGARCSEEHLPYNISLSFGIERITGEETFQEAVKRSDQDLYRNKKKQKVGR